MFCNEPNKKRSVMSDRCRNIKVSESTRRMMMKVVKGSGFLGENTENVDRLQLLSCEQKSIYLTHRLNAFTRRGTMRSEFKLRCKEELNMDWRTAVCHFCKRGPAIKRCSQCNWLCCSRCIEKRIYGRCWRCLGHSCAGALGLQMRRLEEWRRGRLGALEGPSKWQYNEELDLEEALSIE